MHVSLCAPLGNVLKILLSEPQRLYSSAICCGLFRQKKNRVSMEGKRQLERKVDDARYDLVFHSTEEEDWEFELLYECFCRPDLVA